LPAAKAAVHIVIASVFHHEQAAFGNTHRAHTRIDGGSTEVVAAGRLSSTRVWAESHAGGIAHVVGVIPGAAVFQDGAGDEIFGSAAFR
jgi:hypothetical protein